jgi:hypothetical protein
MIECWETHIYIRAEYLQTNWNTASLGVGMEKIERCQFKSLIDARVEEALEGHAIKDLKWISLSEPKVWADTHTIRIWSLA